MLDENELLFDELYEKTKDCGRVQFIKLLMENEREHQELKTHLEGGKEQYHDLVEEKENLQEQLSNSHQIKAQQREFIEWLEDGIRILEMLEETFILINYKNEIRIYKEILSKYKEITGVKDGEN